MGSEVPDEISSYAVHPDRVTGAPSSVAAHATGCGRGNAHHDAFSLDTGSDGNAEWTHLGRLADVVPGRGR
jgi:hypothetical protein